MKRTIMFAGPLADRFTNHRFKMDCDDILTLFSGLEANFPGFKGELRQYRDVAFVKVQGEQVKSLTEDQFPMSFGSADTLIVSAAEDGSAMMAVEWVAAALESYGVSAAVAGVVAYVAVNVAIAYAASAIMKSLSKSPDTSSSTKAQNASYLFNGAQNIVEQGGAIPLIYGRFRVGGTIISSDISTDRLPSLNPDSFSITSAGTFTGNVVANDVLRDYITVTSWTIDNTGTYSAGQTYSTGSGDGAWSLTIAANGNLTFTNGASVGGTIAGSYTVNDSSTGRTLSSRYTLNVTATQTWSNSDPTWTFEIA